MAPGRLGKRARRLRAYGKHANQVVGAIARPRMGIMGAMATQVPVTPYGHEAEPDWPHNAAG
jgi:hypothetical protein